MTASSRGSRAAASIIRSSRHPHPLVCSDCISHLTTRTPPLSRRHYAVAATSLKTSDAAPNSSLPHLDQKFPLVTSSSQNPEYVPKAGVLLSRAPLLTAPQTAFEKAYYFYQKRLNERLAMPFTRYFYFKSDTPADTDWKIKARERNGAAARELGGYRAYGEESWNDELLSSDAAAGAAPESMTGKMGIAEPKYLIDSLVRDSKVRAVEGKDGSAVEVKEGEGDSSEAQVEKPLSRFTEADRTNDTSRLDRKLTQTLYLLVKKEIGGWGFPSDVLVGRENLHQAAERILVQTGGVNMNTWIVGHVPVGHHILPPKFAAPEYKEIATPGVKTFFMKGRIMAGQADLKGSVLGYKEFKWLTKSEIEKHVSNRYFSFVRNMLADR